MSSGDSDSSEFLVEDVEAAVGAVNLDMRSRVSAFADTTPRHAVFELAALSLRPRLGPGLLDHHIMMNHHGITDGI